MEAFEREILRYEHASGEGVSDALRVGIVLRQLEEAKLKEYLLLMNASKLTVWKYFKAEVNTIKRTQANIGPMDLDAFTNGKNKGAKNAWDKGKGKGGKDAKGKGKKGACFVCGSPDHMQAQCPKGKGKGGKGKGKDAKGKAQCH
eukprot:989009-Amphidinium_carterae.1